MNKKPYFLILVIYVFIWTGCNFNSESTKNNTKNVQPENKSMRCVNAGHFIAKTYIDFDRDLFIKKGFTVKDIKDFSFDEDVRYWYLFKNSKNAVRELNLIDGVLYAENDHLNKIPAYSVSSFNAMRALEEGNLDGDIRSKFAGYSLASTQALDSYKINKYGKNHVTAAIIDSGINMAHEDLCVNGKTIVRYAKSAFRHDSSGSGFHYFYVGDKKPFVNIPLGENWDDLIHGTHCAGIIAAVGDNGKGCCGVAYKNTDLISYKAIADAYDSGVDWAIYGAVGDLVSYVKEERKNGRLLQKTIPLNISLSSTEGGIFPLEMINAAFKEGIVTVAACANNGRYMPSYPGAYPGVFTCASVNASDTGSVYNNTGLWINAAAPGENIISCGSRKNNDYVILSGSSMAAPFVSGTIAYLLSFNDQLSPVEITEILEVTADKIDIAGASYNSEGFSEKYGFGRINVLKAASLVKNGEIEINGKKITMQEIGKKYSSKAVCIKVINRGDNPEERRVSLYEGDVCLVSVKVPKGNIEFYGLKNGYSYKIRTQSLKNTIERTIVVSDQNQNIILDAAE